MSEENKSKVTSMLRLSYSEMTFIGCFLDMAIENAPQKEQLGLRIRLGKSARKKIWDVLLQAEKDGLADVAEIQKAMGIDGQEQAMIEELEETKLRRLEKDLDRCKKLLAAVFTEIDCKEVNLKILRSMRKRYMIMFSTAEVTR